MTGEAGIAAASINFGCLRLSNYGIVKSENKFAAVCWPIPSSQSEACWHRDNVSAQRFLIESENRPDVFVFVLHGLHRYEAATWHRWHLAVVTLHSNNACPEFYTTGSLHGQVVMMGCRYWSCWIYYRVWGARVRIAAGHSGRASVWVQANKLSGVGVWPIAHLRWWASWWIATREPHINVHH